MTANNGHRLQLIKQVVTRWRCFRLIVDNSHFSPLSVPPVSHGTAAGFSPFVYRCRVHNALLAIDGYLSVFLTAGVSFMGFVSQIVHNASTLPC